MEQKKLLFDPEAINTFILDRYLSCEIAVSDDTPPWIKNALRYAQLHGHPPSSDAIQRDIEQDSILDNTLHSPPTPHTIFQSNIKPS